MHWRRQWQPTPVFLPGESQGRRSWWAAVYGVAQSRTLLKRLSSSRQCNVFNATSQVTNAWTFFFFLIWEMLKMLGLTSYCYVFQQMWWFELVVLPLFNFCSFSESESENVSRSVTSNSCYPMDYSPPGSSVHGILQARILKWVAMPFPTQGLNLCLLCLLYCRRILYLLSHQGSPRMAVTGNSCPTTNGI